jgi:hypothetical protein
MATVQVPKQAPPTTIDIFRGLNESDSGDTQLELGEASTMKNFRLTTNAKLRKREGYAELFDSLGDFDIQGMWHGKVAGTHYLLFACNGNVYKRVADVNTSIGTLTDAKTTFFSFKEKVYILNASEYYSWDGTTFGVVEGYIPLIATATPPTGGGTPNESLNNLTGKKHQTFSGDAAAVNYQVAEAALTSVDKVYVGGVLKTVTTDYTVNLTTGVVTFVVAPATGVDNVDIQWTKGTGSRSEITGYRYAMLFGGQNDTRVFLYYNGTNRYIYTGLAAGVPSAEYFPALNYREVGSDEFAITDIERQYDRQLIYTDGGETWYSYYDPITLENGDVVADFPTFTLNNAVGNIAPGQVQLIQNNPFSIQNGVYEWQATNVRDERNVSFISQKVRLSMQEIDLTQALTVDWEAMREYWLAIGNQVWIYNYRLGAWYRFETADDITCFLIAENQMYIGTPNGQIMKFDADETSDNGTVISAVWEMGFYDFLAEWLRKFLNRVWISIQPGTRERVDVSWQTDNNASSDETTIEYSFIDFGDVDFDDYSFLTYYNPQPFRLKIKAKKFVYFKLILTADSLTAKATILSINLLSRMGGQTK